MTYAVQTDITALYGPDALFVADRDRDGQVDGAAVDQALVSASDEIDTYLAARYPLPLTSTHEVLKQYCIDIALYRLAISAVAMTDTHRERYKDAIDALKLLADGTTRLFIPVDPNADPAEDPSPNPITTSGPERIFTRDKMKGL